MDYSTTDLWRPSTPAIDAQSLGAAAQGDQFLAVHCWANWNGVDRLFDKVIVDIQPRVRGWVSLFSCDIDDEQNREFCEDHQVVAIPCLVVLHRGDKIGHIIGLCESIALTRKLLDCVSPDPPRMPWWKSLGFELKRPFKNS